MRRTFIKDGLIRSFTVADGKVMTTVMLGDRWVVNPTLAGFYSSGWQDYVEPAPEPYLPTYSELVEEYIRDHGYPTYGAELSVLNNYAADPEAYRDAYNRYQQTRKAAKDYAYTAPHREDD